MVVRMWEGRVPRAKAEAYREFLARRAVPDYRATPGNRQVPILQRMVGDIAHFMTWTTWDDLEAVRAFAGDPVDLAKYYPEDSDFLLEFPPTVTHWDVAE